LRVYSNNKGVEKNGSNSRRISNSKLVGIQKSLPARLHKPNYGLMEVITLNKHFELRDFSQGNAMLQSAQAINLEIAMAKYFYC